MDTIASYTNCIESSDCHVGSLEKIIILYACKSQIIMYTRIIMKLFNSESKSYQWIMDAASIIEFGVLTIFCSLPIITAGAACSAMYKMYFDMRRDRSVSASAYFHEFGSSFKNSLLIELIQIATGVIIVFFDYMTYQAGVTNSVSPFLIIPVVVFTVIWVIIFAYAYALTAYFEQTVGITIRNAFIMALGYLKNTLIILGLSLILPVIYLIIPDAFFKLIPIWILAIIPAIHWWKSRFYMQVFMNYDHSDAYNVTEVNNETEE